MRRHWTLTSWFIFGLCVAASLPTFVAAALGSKYLTTNPIFGFQEFVSQEDPKIAIVARGVEAILSVCVIYRNAPTSGRRVNVAAALTLVVAVIGVTGGHTTQSLLMLLVFAAAMFAGRGQEVAMPVAVYAVGLGILSAFVTVVHYPITVISCDYKCGPMGVLYYGAFNNENELALALALAVPFVWLAFTGRIRGVLLVYIVGLTVLTGSRTGAAAAGLALVLILIVRPRYGAAGDDRMTGKHGTLLTLATVGAAAVSLILPFAVSNQNAFTGRPQLWHVALNLWRRSPWFGQGSTAWAQQQKVGNLSKAASYSPHNQWVDVLLAAGIVGAVLLVAAIVVLWRQSAPGGGYVIGVILAPTLAIGATERPLTFYDQSWVAFALVALLLAVPLRPIVSRVPVVDETEAEHDEHERADQASGQLAW